MLDLSYCNGKLFSVTGGSGQPLLNYVGRALSGVVNVAEFTGVLLIQHGAMKSIGALLIFLRPEQRICERLLQALHRICRA